MCNDKFSFFGMEWLVKNAPNRVATEWNVQLGLSHYAERLPYFAYLHIDVGYLMLLH